jgi:hypothetical protein
LDISSVAKGITYIIVVAIITSNPITLYLASLLIEVAKSITLMTHLTLLNLNYPYNLSAFCNLLLSPVINFDILPTDNLYQLMFGISNINDLPRSDQFAVIGYGG